MHVSDIQTLLTEVGWYSGAIDGDAGPLTWAAVAQAEQLQGAEYLEAPARWSRRRRLVGAGQVVLSMLGHEPGSVDGYAGHNTEEALTAWRSAKAGVSVTLDRTPVDAPRRHPVQDRYPRQRDMAGFYGPAGGPRCTAGQVDLPFAMILAWNRDQAIRRFACHELLAGPLTEIFRQAAVHYGSSDIERLQLHVFGGCFNHRKMRGGTALSTHAFGAAVDLNPERNRLRWGPDRAQFAGPEYEPFWNIVMAHGGTPAGYAWGRDWMHFQFARL